MGEDKAMSEFMEGNEFIESAISDYHAKATKKHFTDVIEIVRQRMHEDGHVLIPVIASDKGDEFTFRTVQTEDGKDWMVTFTSQKEYEKGPSSQILSNFIDSVLKACIEIGSPGLVLNPWGESFTLTVDTIKTIFEEDGDVEYHVPDDDITPELLDDGSFLKRATEICNRNWTQLNLIKLARILRDSWVWVPCNAILSDEDMEDMDKKVSEADQSGDLESLVGETLQFKNNVRLVPDILKNGDDYFFPVFTSEEEMGEYGEQFSKVCKHFLETANLARNNEKNVKGIVINAFTEPFIVPVEMFDTIADMPSSLEKEEPENE